MYEEKKTIIISVGGSLIVPDEIDVKWLEEFKELIDKYVNEGYKFIIIAGGGKTARKYQNAAKSIVKLENEDVDWLGIHATRLNAYLLRTIFRSKAKYKIVKNPTENIDFKEDVLIASGWKPGSSTDYCAVLLAKNFNAKKVVNLTNIDYVYDKDPRIFPNATQLKNIFWEDLIKIVGDKWDPGLNTPFDPIASKEAQKTGLEVIIIKGNKLTNFEKFLRGEDFNGTIIEPS